MNPSDSNEITRAVAKLGLEGRDIELHARFRSFKSRIDVHTLVEKLTEAKTTLVAPTFSHRYEIRPAASIQLATNGFELGAPTSVNEQPMFVRAHTDVDSDMGVLGQHFGTFGARGNHPFNSFSAIGTRSIEAVGWQSPARTYGPIEWMLRDGLLLLIGVDLRSATCLHLAERLAGRKHFTRWYFDGSGVREARVGSCSRMFSDFEAFAPKPQTMVVLGSLWKVYELDQLVSNAVSALEDNNQLALCKEPACKRCPIERNRLERR
jgi:aminoglycoside N3'-acetyltransferase